MARPRKQTTSQETTQQTNENIETTPIATPETNQTPQQQNSPQAETTPQTQTTETQAPQTPPNPPLPTKHVLYFIECSSDGIMPQHVGMIESTLGNASGDTLFLVLHTVGGDVYSAVRIMKILQSKFREIKIVIPDYVYSSGTVMSLGGDQIHMAVDATMGPLDKPLEHPTDGSEISSLDVTQTLTNLASICTSTAFSIYEKLRTSHPEMKLSKAESAKLAFDTATKIISPIVDKVDPYNLQRGFRQAKIGLLYAIDMLLSRMMRTNIRQAIETSQRLVDTFPSHGYGIFRDDAQFLLKLNVFPLESLPEWNTIETRFNQIKSGTQVIEFFVL